MKDKLENILHATLESCFNKQVLNETPLPDFVIEIPNNSNHGHFATNLPLTLASSQKMPPLRIASIILENLRDDIHLIENVRAAAPGFINFFIRAEMWHHVLLDIIQARSSYGRNTAGNGQKVLIEYVSANPTGPLHVGSGRGAALGDTLSRILSYCGYRVDREFYVNDAGLQIRLLGESIYNRFKTMSDPKHPFPENGYHGEYIIELARIISTKYELDKMPEEEAIELCARKGKEIMLRGIKEDLSLFDVTFDIWSSESELHASGLLTNTLAQLRDKKLLFERDGAEWIKTSDFGDDKDRVLKKKDGHFTYFASDIAYHFDKHARGYQKAINIWGADHHGYVPRMQAALKANGISEHWLSVMIMQLVKLWKTGQEIKMSKRSGTYVTLNELIDEVGIDATRFIFLTKNHESPLDFDIDLVKKRDSENPVYYVQYAHARICSLFKKAGEKGFSLSNDIDGLLDRLVLNEEIALIRHMAQFPELLQEISKSLEPHRLTYYLGNLAALFHKYFNLGTKMPENRIITDDGNLTRARLLLSEAVRFVIAGGLNLLGVHAPKQM